MSSLSIWDPSRQGPKPQTFDEVLAQFRQLSGQADQPNYWFASFAQHIQNVVNSQPQVPQEWRDRYGHFVARAQSVEQAIWHIELPAASQTAMRKLMVDTATMLGLVVYDDDLALAFLRGDIVLPAERRSSWDALLAPPEADHLPGEDEAEQFVTEQMLQAFGPLGFTASKGQFGAIKLTRQLPGGGGQKIGFSIIADAYKDAYRFGVTTQFSHEAVQALYQRFKFTNDEPFFGSAPPPLDLQKRIFYLSTYQEARAAVASVYAFLEPILATTTTLQGLDSLMNGSLYPEGKERSRDGGRSSPHILIVARLVGNPDYDAIEAELTEGYMKSNWVKTEPNQSEWNRLVAYLRTEVQPLV
ncbi:hypothetical protein HNQ59_003904 [Chitinivorax tropicus]|uniref:Uncharacterized protein n=1 Tax=Chitinivorax tropicus TaxID=714531 RepID=A0A840MW35_9PROT|nr:hypothetical protein [Chitinivorax tropicus]MBB5020583.1 hypothetical protein [Chitinivorax tropicus]